MSRQGRFILLGGIPAGMLLIGVFIYYATASQPAVGAARPPELGRRQVPAKAYEIPFDQKFDVFCSFYGEERAVYRNCKILGFTGRDEESAGAGRASGFSFSSSSSHAREWEYFDHWLVLELTDGRSAYIPPGAVKFIEDASPASQ